MNMNMYSLDDDDDEILQDNDGGSLSSPHFYQSVSSDADHSVVINGTPATFDMEDGDLELNEQRLAVDPPYVSYADRIFRKYKDHFESRHRGGGRNRAGLDEKMFISTVRLA